MIHGKPPFINEIKQSFVLKLSSKNSDRNFLIQKIPEFWANLFPQKFPEFSLFRKTKIPGIS